MSETLDVALFSEFVFGLLQVQTLRYAHTDFTGVEMSMDNKVPCPSARAVIRSRSLRNYPSDAVHFTWTDQSTLPTQAVKMSNSRCINSLLYRFG